MNIKKTEGELISMGYNQSEVKEILDELQELRLFVKFMQNKYDSSEEEVQKMYEMYVETRATDSEEKMMVGIDETEDDEIIIEKMVNNIVDLSIEMMYDYSVLHGYDNTKKYKDAAEVYINKLLKGQIKETFLKQFKD